MPSVTAGLFRRSRWPIGFARPLWLAGASLLLIGFAAHYYSLRRTVRRRTQDLSASVSKLEAANRELERLARVDAVTGLGNRQSFYEEAAREIERAKRHGGPLSLTLVDLDRFKDVNDRFGHLTGDAVFQAFAEALEAKLRKSDFLARIGGDEFIALLPETTGDNAVLLIRRILKEWSESEVEQGGTRIKVSFSTGVAHYQNDASIEEWIRRADASLYQSKSEGRGKVSAG